MSLHFQNFVFVASEADMVFFLHSKQYDFTKKICTQFQNNLTLTSGVIVSCYVDKAGSPTKVVINGKHALASKIFQEYT